MGARENQRRPDLEHIGRRAGGADQHTLVPQAVDETRGNLGCRCFRRVVRNEFDTDKKTGSPHIANQRVALSDRDKAISQMSAHQTRILDQALTFDDVEYRLPTARKPGYRRRC